MSAIKFRAEELASRMGEPAPVAAPFGEIVSLVRSYAMSPNDAPRTRTGIWECSPGRWRRQVTQAEFCYFLEGECVFTPDLGAPIEVRAGDALYFPPNSTGVWEIRRTARKIFIVFDQGGAT
ncbi:MAG: cupin domain-containing protein [Steroidobacteraceae bacterium]